MQEQYRKFQEIELKVTGKVLDLTLQKLKSSKKLTEEEIETIEEAKTIIRDYKKYSSSKKVLRLAKHLFDKFKAITT